MRFTVARDGRVTAVRLVHGSGSLLLDTVAAELLRDARVPPFPDTMPQSEVTVTLSIRYALEH